ncbi:unnamed protein product [Linum trigynum]|uniref:Uncharacterized protein n=1 Tax=Linum trigynum TaxID=586398 RepID=A0AAV2CVM2_9ROSI
MRHDLRGSLKQDITCNGKAEAADLIKVSLAAEDNVRWAHPWRRAINRSSTKCSHLRLGYEGGKSQIFILNSHSSHAQNLGQEFMIRDRNVLTETSVREGVIRRSPRLA